MIKFLDLQKVTESHGADIREAVERVIRSGWYLQGTENAQFEANYARYIGTRHAIGVANGLDALVWIFRAYLEMGVLQPGDEVIVPANTYIASILAITENGLVPVLVEPDLQTYQIDDTRIEAAITPRTRAILIVHLYGQCAYTDRIGQLCRKYGLKLVEDNAQAHGCLYRGRRTGSLGDAELAATLRALAKARSTQNSVFRYTGRNSRLDEIEAAILDVKLRHLDEDNARRKAIAAHYLTHITNPKVVLPQVPAPDAHVFHIFPVRCAERDALQQYLTANGVQTLIHYPIPPHKQECYRAWNDRSLPITELIHDEELSLPISQVMSDEEVRYVVTTINAF